MTFKPNKKYKKKKKNTDEELPRIGWDNKKLETPTIKYVIEALQKSYLVRSH